MTGSRPSILHPSEAGPDDAKLASRPSVNSSLRKLRWPRRNELEDGRCTQGCGIGVEGHFVRATHATTVHGAEEMLAVRSSNRGVEIVGQQSDRKTSPQLKICSVRMNGRLAAIRSADAAAIHSGHKVAVVGLQRKCVSHLIHPDQREGLEGPGSGCTRRECHPMGRGMRISQPSSVHGGHQMAILSPDGTDHDPRPILFWLG